MVLWVQTPIKLVDWWMIAHTDNTCILFCWLGHTKKPSFFSSYLRCSDSHHHGHEALFDQLYWLSEIWTLPATDISTWCILLFKSIHELGPLLPHLLLAISNHCASIQRDKNLPGCHGLFEISSCYNCWSRGPEWKQHSCANQVWLLHWRSGKLRRPMK